MFLFVNAMAGNVKPSEPCRRTDFPNLDRRSQAPGRAIRQDRGNLEREPTRRMFEQPLLARRRTTPRPSRTCVATAVFVVMLALSFDPAAQSNAVCSSTGSADATQCISALGREVESVAARTRPPHWPMKRSCLYYALAGRAILARHGINATLRVGAVDYFPGTPWEHPIDPHAWLETETHFIDYATLPRCGQVSLIPRDRVANQPEAVRPGVTQVLTLPSEPDRALTTYLRHHARRFRQWLRTAPPISQ